MKQNKKPIKNYGEVGKKRTQSREEIKTVSGKDNKKGKLEAVVQTVIKYIQKEKESTIKVMKTRKNGGTKDKKNLVRVIEKRRSGYVGGQCQAYMKKKKTGNQEGEEAGKKEG